MSELTENGLAMDRKPDVQEKLEARFRTDHGDNIRLTPKSQFGLETEVTADTVSITNELIETLNTMFDLDSAFGVFLEQLVRILGIEKKQAQKSQVTLTLTSNGAQSDVLLGDIFTDLSQTVSFALDAAHTIPAGGAIDVSASGTVEGPMVAEAATLTRIENPRAGLLSSINASRATVGWEAETTPALRGRAVRRAAKTSFVSASSYESNLANIDGVNQVIVHQNASSSVDALGVSPGFIWPIVNGGSDADIAETLFNSVAAGTGYHGSVSYLYTDPVRGTSQTVRWGRTIDVFTYILVGLRKKPEYPSDGDAAVKQKIVEFFDGDFMLDGSVVPGPVLGEDVSAGRLYSPVNSVAGHSIQFIYISRAAGPTSGADMPIAINEIAVTNSTIIDVVLA